MSNKTAAHRKNGPFGYKALVRYADGKTHIPVGKNFATAEAARAYAQKWIEANDAPRDYAAAKARKDAAYKAAYRATPEYAAWLAASPKIKPVPES